jgi:hypothetical protein
VRAANDRSLCARSFARVRGARLQITKIVTMDGREEAPYVRAFAERFQSVCPHAQRLAELKLTDND